MLDNKSGDFAASGQQLNSYSAKEREQEEALARLSLSNAEQLAKLRLEQLTTLTNQATKTGKDVIDVLIEHLLTQGLKAVTTLGAEAKAKGKTAITNTTGELETSGKAALDKLLQEYLEQVSKTEQELADVRSKQRQQELKQLTDSLKEDISDDTTGLNTEEDSSQEPKFTQTEESTKAPANEVVWGITKDKGASASPKVDRAKNIAEITKTGKAESSSMIPVEQIKTPAEAGPDPKTVAQSESLVAGLEAIANIQQTTPGSISIDTPQVTESTPAVIEAEATVTPNIKVVETSYTEVLTRISGTIDSIVSKTSDAMSEVLKASDVLTLQVLLSDLKTEQTKLEQAAAVEVAETVETAQTNVVPPVAPSTADVLETLKAEAAYGAQDAEAENNSQQQQPTRQPESVVDVTTAQAVKSPTQIFNNVESVVEVEKPSQEFKQLYETLRTRQEELFAKTTQVSEEATEAEIAEKQRIAELEAQQADALHKAEDDSSERRRGIRLKSVEEIIKSTDAAFDAYMDADRFNELRKLEGLEKSQRTALRFATDTEYRIKQLNEALGTDEGDRLAADFKLLEAKRQLELDTEAELLNMGLSQAEIIASRDADATRAYLEEEQAERVAAAEAAAGVLEDLRNNISNGIQIDPAVLAEAERIAKEAKDAVAAGEAEKAKAIANLEKTEKDRNKIKEKLEKKAHQERLKKASEVASEMFNSKESKLEFLQDPKGSLTKAKNAIKDQNPDMSDADVNGAILSSATGMLDDLAAELKSKAAGMSKPKALINTRLQGTSFLNVPNIAGDYWFTLNNQIGLAAGASLTHKQEDIVKSLTNLANVGISYHIGQRAFLDTIKDKIATTFEATDGTLLKLVRIQQADTTAARLGMESALTAFLNNMYATTEYLNSIADSVRGNIYEASALMSAKEALSFEYQVQKWMGSLHSVGFSNTEGLSAAFGKLAAGDISGITEGGYGNLLVMAANKANLSLSTLLANGIDDSETNKLFKAMVEYLAQIYEESKDSKVVQQQFANVYGLTASDLKAASTLSASTKAIEKEHKDFGSMMGRLFNMTSTMILRTDVGEITTNLRENLMYNMAALYNNPITMAAYEMANMLEQFGGGINIPFINVKGFGLDVNAKVSDLMKIASMSVPVLGGAAKALASLAAGMAGGAGTLAMMGITTNLGEVTRGGGGSVFSGLTKQSGSGTSQSGYVGNSSASDIQDKTMSDSSEDGNNQIAAAKEEEDDIKNKQKDEHIVQIYELLQEVVNGSKTLTIYTT